MTGYKTVDEYINVFPNNIKEKLKLIRKTIKEVIPEAEEVISYRIPTFKIKGKYLIYFAGFKDHVSIYPTTESLEKAVEGVVKYKKGKGTLRFPLDKEIPTSLIKKIVKFKLKERGLT